MAGVVLEHLEKPKSPRLDPGDSGGGEDGSMLRQEAGHLGAAQVSLQYSWTSARDLGEIVAGTFLCLKGREELVLPHSSSVLPNTRVPWDPHGHGGLRGGMEPFVGFVTTDVAVSHVCARRRLVPCCPLAAICPPGT